MNYRVVMRQNEDGSFVASCPELPGCIGSGTTHAEALANIEDAIRAHVESRNQSRGVRCGAAHCDAEPMFQITHFESRRVVLETYFCEQHARSFFTESRSKPCVPTRSESVTFDGIRLEPEMMVYHRRGGETPACICLREVGGMRRIWMFVDGWAWWALIEQFKRESAPSPRTHAAWAETIKALGGNLQAAVIDRTSEQEKWWSAIIRIDKRGGRVATVNVRASDAIILAVFYDVPILIAEEALAKFADAGNV